MHRVDRTENEKILIRTAKIVSILDLTHTLQLMQGNKSDYHLVTLI